MNRTTEFFLIRALGGDNVDETIESFLRWGGDRLHRVKINIVDECETREVTLNKIAELRDKAKDCLIFVDDIRFEGDWWSALESAEVDADIVGFSMVDPKTGKLQDFGYDFILLDGRLTYRGLHKHSDPKKLNLPDCRQCDSVCGCCMWIRKEVFDAVSQFPEEGCNRWGEMLFSHLAKRKGFRTVVLAHHLKHYGTSTKNTGDAVLSSPSWLVERELWEQVAHKFFYDVIPSGRVSRLFESELEQVISAASKIMIYGCGTVAELIGERLLANKQFTVVSALPEEVGVRFLDRVVQPLSECNSDEWELILVTPIGYRHVLEPMFEKDERGQLIFLRETCSSSEIIYSIDH